MMKYKRCIIDASFTDNTNHGIISLPISMFEKMPASSTFLMLKKSESGVIRLFPLPTPDSKVYEIFCEVKNKWLSFFISRFQHLADSTMGLSVFPVLDGIHAGGKLTPSTFDGFVVVTDVKYDPLDLFINKLKKLQVNRELLLENVEFEEIK